MRSLSGYVPPALKEGKGKVKVVITGQHYHHERIGNDDGDEYKENKARLRRPVPLWAHKAKRTMGKWFAGCWGGHGGEATHAADERLLNEDEQSDEEAERDRKLLCEEWSTEASPVLSRHAALAFFRRTAKGRHTSSTEGQIGRGVRYG